MIQGQTIQLIRKQKTGEKHGGDDVWEELPPLDIDNVLVMSGAQTNSTETNRPDGTVVAATFYFPRSFTMNLPGSLRHATIRAEDRKFIVIGDPFPLKGNLTPTAWNMAVETTSAEA